VDLKLGHHATDGIEVVDVQGEIDMYTAPRLRELLIDLVSKGSYQLAVNLEKVGLLDSARQSSWPGRRVASSIRPTGIRPSRTSTTNWDAGHGFELVSRVVVQHRVRIR
jgi:hypothetical protein